MDYNKKTIFELETLLNEVIELADTLYKKDEYELLRLNQRKILKKNKL